VTDTSEPVVPQPPDPAPGLGRAVARSSVWSLGGQVGVLVVSFVATPFTVRLLGPEGYGLLALVNSLIAYVTVIDLGMGTASTRFASDAYARGDEREEAAAVWTASAITLVPSTIVAAIIWLTAPAIAHRVLHLQPNLLGSGALALRLGSVALVARILASVLNTPELVRLRWDLYVLVTNGSGVAQVVVVPIVVAFGAGVGGAVGVIAVAAVAATVLHFIVGAKLAPALRRPSVRPDLARPLIRFGGGLVVANVLGLVLGSGERLILAATYPIRAMAHYSVAANLSQVIAVVPIAICQPLLPAFSRLAAGSDTGQASQLYRRALTSILVGILPIAVVLAVIGKPFLSLWAGGEYGQASVTPLRILLIGVVVNACAFVPYNFLLGHGASRAIVRCHLLELPLYPLYAFALIARFGATGAALVWTLRLVLVSGVLFLAAARRGGAGAAELKRVGAGLAPAVAVLLLPLAVESLVGGVAVTIATLVVTLPAYAWLAWGRALGEADRTQILALVPHRRSR